MARMTDEEAARLDEKWTKNPPSLVPTARAILRDASKQPHPAALLIQ